MHKKAWVTNYDVASYTGKEELMKYKKRLVCDFLMKLPVSGVNYW